MEAIAHASSRSLIHGAPSPQRRTASPAGLGVRPLGAPSSKLSSSSTSLRKLPCQWSLRRKSFPTACVKASLTADDLDVVPMTSKDPVDQQQGESVLVGIENIEEKSPSPGGFSPEPPFTFDLSSMAASSSGSGAPNDTQLLVASATGMVHSTIDSQYVDRAINAAIVGLAGAFAITKILTVDHDYWHGWTLFEILKYAPLHNWTAYEEALKTNPILAKMMISGVVYAIGDCSAQCYEGKPILEINRQRMIRSGMVGFCLHGSLSHFYYHFCEALFPFQGWWLVPVKVVFDQTIWSAFWNSVYFVTLGILRLESPASIAAELRATFWPMLTAGWKLWPFAHLITYGVIPVEQRLLWVDCVELVWVTILSMYSNEKVEARLQEGGVVDTVAVGGLSAHDNEKL